MRDETAASEGFAADEFITTRHMRVVSLIAAVILFGCRLPAVPGAGDTAAVRDSGAAYFPGSVWRTAAPAQAGFDAQRASVLTRDVTSGRFGAVDALIVVRFGHLVIEHYDGWSPTQAHTVQSVTKSVTSLLFGLLQAEHTGSETSLDRTVADALATYQPLADDDARKRALTLRHLLMMRTDMDFWEQPYPGSPLDQLNRSSGDWIRFILDRPMVGMPGDDWAYNSGAAILVCGVIRQIAGESAFARRELFEPVGVVGETWAKSPFDGLPHCGGGLSLKPIDLARVGYLVLRHGRWGDRQLVPADWIDVSTSPLSRGSSLLFSAFNSGYGYFWWTFPLHRGGTDAGVIAASGSGGQWLFVIPSLDLVVAIAARSGAGLDLLYDGVLPALR
jgi:CubicO group peptidase (beta-lactamase class C family)